MSNPPTTKPAFPDEYLGSRRKSGMYYEHEGEMWRLFHREKDNSWQTQRLTNFTAEITEDRRVDDGDETRREFLIYCQNHGASYPVKVPASDYGSLAWVHDKCGALFCVSAGHGVKDHARAAIQDMSKPKLKTIYSHTGWSNQGGEWLYFTGSTAIGKDGIVNNIDVQLDGNFEAFGIQAPDLPEVDCVRASLSLLGLGTEDITVPLLACVYLAPMVSMFTTAPPQFVPWFWGGTGRFKSAVLSLAQSHFGLFGETQLPGSFMSTANAIERQCHILKDSLFVIDDLFPASSRKEADAQSAILDRILRSAGNSKGRDRMRADTTMRGGLRPRGLVVATSERLPSDVESATSRSFTVEFPAGGIDQKSLTKAQSKIKLYSGAMYAYIKWLAEHYDEIQATVHGDYLKLRSEIGENASHKRQAGQVAHMVIAIRTFMRFALEIGATNKQMADRICVRSVVVLSGGLTRNSVAIEDIKPAKVFFDLLGAAIQSGRVYISGATKSRPDNPEEWGWMPYTEISNGQRYTEYKPITQTGWIGQLSVDGQFVDLDPDLSFRAVVQEAHAQQKHFPVAKVELQKMLFEAGLTRGQITTGDIQRHLWRVKVNGQAKWVLRVILSALRTDEDCDE